MLSIRSKTVLAWNNIFVKNVIQILTEAALQIHKFYNSDSRNNFCFLFEKRPNQKQKVSK